MSSNNPNEHYWEQSKPKKDSPLWPTKGINLPRINSEVHKRRIRIEDMTSRIQKAIDGFCTENDFDVAYSDIDAALLNVMSSNNRYVRKMEVESEADS